MLGTFHFHSTYSHDGRNTLRDVALALKARGLDFCVMTEHFEDFDANTFQHYLDEISDVSKRCDFVFIPGVEIHLSGLDTIVFPASDFEELTRLSFGRQDAGKSMFKVLAHPNKYTFEKVISHVEAYDIRAVEMWNQQADGSYAPPFQLLDKIKTQSWRNDTRFFFGCDLHSSTLDVNNILRISPSVGRNPGAIARELIFGDFDSTSVPTGIVYRNGIERTDFDTWLEELNRGSYRKAGLRRVIRKSLKPFYSILPRFARRALNDFKNSIRNKL